MRGELLERGALDRLARLLVRRRSGAAARERREVDDPLRRGLDGHDPERLRGRSALQVRCRGVGGQARRLLAVLRDGICERGTLAELEHEVAARRAQRLVDAGQHAAKAVGAVRREEAQPLVSRSGTGKAGTSAIGRLRRAYAAAAGAELAQRPVERLAAQHRRARFLELAEARVEPDRERMRLEEPVAEAVNGRDPGAVEVAREIRPPALAQRGPDAGAELARRLARVRDDEDRVDVEAVVADGADVALDEHRGLARARAGGDEDAARRLDRGELLVVEAARGFERRHWRGTRQIVQRSHHDGHPSPFGS